MVIWMTQKEFKNSDWQIPDSPQKWGQMMYRQSAFDVTFPNSFLGLEHWNSCSKGYTLDINIPYLYPQSTLKTNTWWCINHSIQMRSPDHLLGPLDCFGCITGCSPAMMILSWNSNSLQKNGSKWKLNHSNWQGCLTLSFSTHSGYSHI